MDLQTEIRPKLKQDSIFLKTRDGVFLQSDTATFLLKGKTLYQWLSLLRPYLTGEHTLGEICESLAPEQQEMVRKLVDSLLQRGVIKNHLQESPDLLPEAVSTYFKAQIELIDHYVERPVERFKTFRESRILLRGAGEAFTALALSLLRNGLQQLYLLPDDEPTGYLAHLEQERALLLQAGIEAAISCPAPSTVKQYDLVVYCADECSLQEVAEIQQACIREQKLFLPSIVFGKQALIGPFVQPDNGPCWICAQMRLSANASNEEQAALWRELALGHELSSWHTPLFLPQARNLGNGTGFELFKYLTNCLPSEATNGVIFHDLETLESSHSAIIRHPLCPVCSSPTPEQSLRQLSEVLEGKRDVEVELGDELLRQFTLLVNARAGLFQQFVDDTIMQLPLKASRLLVQSPGSPFSSGFEITAYNANTLLEARLTAMSEAVSRYISSLPDRRTMLLASWNELQHTDKKAILPAHLSTWSNAAACDKEMRMEWFPACSLTSREVYYVPAAALYPSSRLNQHGLFEKTPAGTATHTNVQDLLSAGLTSALAYEHIRDLLRGHNALVRLEKEQFEGIDSNLTFLYNNAQHFQRPFALWEVLHASPLHLILACTTDQEEQPIFAFGRGLSGPAALSDALLHLVGDLQFLKYEGKVPALTAGTIFPKFSLHADLTFAETTRSRFQEPATTLAELQQHLRATGRDMLFAHTTTADIWETHLFISGRVLLTQDAPRPLS